MPTISIDDFLEHHGVKGQQWGIRSKTGSGGSAKASTSSSTGHLSNDELRKVVDRMRLEQQHSELSSPKKKAGTTYAKQLLKNSGNTLVGVAVGAIATKAVKKVLN